MLVIDDMENVHKKVRSLIPAERDLNASLNATDALALCRANPYGTHPDRRRVARHQSALIDQTLRLLQPKAVLVAMALRTANNVAGEMRTQGFDDVLFKPFANEAVAGLAGTKSPGNPTNWFPPRRTVSGWPGSAGATTSWRATSRSLPPS